MRLEKMMPAQILLLTLVLASSAAAGDCVATPPTPATIRLLYPQVISLVFSGPPDTPDTMLTLKVRVDQPEQPESQITIVQYRSKKFSAFRQLLADGRASVWEQIYSQICRNGYTDAKSIAQGIKVREVRLRIASDTLEQLVQKYSNLSVRLYSDPFVVELHATYYSVSFSSEYSNFSAYVPGSTPSEPVDDPLIRWIQEVWRMAARG